MTETLSWLMQLQSSQYDDCVRYADSVDEHANKLKETVESATCEQSALCDNAAQKCAAAKEVRNNKLVDS